MISKENHISINKTAEIIGVSEATIKNWIRHNYLTPIKKENSTLFCQEEVNALQDKIKNGKIERLNKRANKRSSAKSFVPKEYVDEKKSDEWLIPIIEHIKTYSLKLEISIYYLALNILKQEQFVFFNNNDQLLKFNEANFKNVFLLKVFKEFYLNEINSSIDKSYYKLLDFNIPRQRDVLGLLYQSIKSEGDKAKQGSYYTPKHIVDEIVFEYVKKDSKVLDPCCGTGQFLLGLNGYIGKPNQIYGFDIDFVAVFICKLNLILAYKDQDFDPKIYHLNTLTDIDYNSLFSGHDLPEGFDLILTNPPWGLHFTNGILGRLKCLYPQIVSLESFSYFLVKSISLLKPNGMLSFILPESILNIKVHNDIRRIVLSNTSILKIVKLGRAFTNVFTNAVRLDLKKQTVRDTSTEVIFNISYKVDQKRFLNNPDYIFDIDINNEDNKIIDKVYSKPFHLLKNNAEWALGIVTGDNNKFLQKEYGKGLEAIFKGKEVNKYFLEEPSNFISFEPEKFQQVAPVEKYRAKEKLIYRFISSKLVFAYDFEQKLTLNSANILIPRIENYPIKVVLALFNSSLFQFVYLKKFNTIKVLRGNLEELPITIFPSDVYQKIIDMVNAVLNRKKDGHEIDLLIMDLFNISQSEQDYIFQSI